MYPHTDPDQHTITIASPFLSSATSPHTDTYSLPAQALPSSSYALALSGFDFELTQVINFKLNLLGVGASNVGVELIVGAGLRIGVLRFFLMIANSNNFIWLTSVGTKNTTKTISATQSTPSRAPATSTYQSAPPSPSSTSLICRSSCFWRTSTARVRCRMS